ncbi:MAG: tetratricopeptide repeat protein, partial [Myxococcales bacterium]
MAFQQKDFLAARRRAEAGLALCEELGGQPEALRRCALMTAHLHMINGDWSSGQAVLERAVNALSERWLYSEFSVDVRRTLGRVLFERERYADAERAIQETLPLAEDGSEQQARLKYLLALVWARTGRVEQAVTLARQNVELVCQQRGAESFEAVLATRWLVEVMVEGEVQLDEAIRLAVSCVNSFRPDDDVVVENLLASAVLLGTALNRRGQHNEAAAVCERVLQSLGPQGQGAEPPFARELEALERVRADALVGLGRAEEAIGLYQSSLRSLELRSTPRDKNGLLTLDGLAEAYRALGRVEEAARTERKAEAIRMQATGRTAAEVRKRSAPPSAVTTVWPRRRLAGVFTLVGADEDAVRRILDVVHPGECGPLAYLMSSPTESQLAVPAHARIREPQQAMEVQ